MPTFDRCQSRYDAMLPRDFEVIDEFDESLVDQDREDLDEHQVIFDEQPYPFEAGHTWPLSDEEDDREKTQVLPRV